MNLKDTYYSLSSHLKENDNDIFEVNMHSDHPVYEGHFPGMPVSPGVYNIQMIKECTSIAIKKELYIDKISMCKLSALMSPIDNPKVYIKIKNNIIEDNKYQITATIEDDVTIFMTFKGELKEKEL